MSRLRRAFAHELRDAPPIDSPYTDSYGVAGYGKWGSGMAWEPWNLTNVSTDQAMRLSAVFACLRLLNDAISTLPLDTFVRRGGIREPYRPRPAWLDFNPPSCDRISYLSQTMLSLLTQGNAYAYVERNADTTVRQLVPLDPTKVEPHVDDNGRLTYKLSLADGVHELEPLAEILHTPGMVLPGRVAGVSPIAYAREAISLGLNAQRYGNSFFENGALPAATIEVPEGKTFSKEAQERFDESWNAKHQGVGKANRIGVLTGGAQLSRVSVAPADAQFLETRQFQVPDIARIFGVPPHLIADASGSTSWGSGLAEQNLAFGQYSLRAWIERIEMSHGRLLTRDGLADVFVKLNLDALLRASLSDRYESYAVGIEKGFLDENEARALEDMQPLPARIKVEDVEKVAALIRAGFRPAAACRAVGIPEIEHSGILPVTVQPEEQR